MPIEQRRAKQRAYYAAHPGIVSAYSRAWRQAHPESERERHHRWRDGNRETYRASQRRAAAKLAAERPEVIREKRRRYMERADRPCRHAKDGCPELAIRWSHSCLEHDRLDTARRRKRKRIKLATRLAMAQGWTCTWCQRPLPEDLDGTVVDHVIPQSAGGPDEAWNFELLHLPCNGPGGKWDTITLKAWDLAVRHGLALQLQPGAIWLR
jgi:hypothetical protein